MVIAQYLHLSVANRYLHEIIMKKRAQPLFEFRHFKVLTFSDHFWMTTWKWLWLCGILAAGSRQWLVMCDVWQQSRKAAAHSMLLQAVCVKYWLLIFTCIYIVACAGLLATWLIFTWRQQEVSGRSVLCARSSSVSCHVSADGRYCLLLSATQECCRAKQN